jgi:DinB family protein
MVDCAAPMQTIWDERQRRALKERFAAVGADARPAWGRMSAPQMITHAADSLRMALGELACAPRRLPLRYTPIKQLVIYWLPFPKGAPTAPELLARVPGAWPADVADVAALLDRLGQRGPGGSFPDHPAFGRLTGRAWGVLISRHLDHHLRQFGA